MGLPAALRTLLGQRPLCSAATRGISDSRSQGGPLPSQDLEGVAAHLRNCQHVIVMVGAGLSVSAGIPDFRTPGTGLYDNLQKYDLPYPEAIFDLGFFRSKPKAFYTLCREMWPGQYRPTPAHYFITLLHRKGMLERCYSQNIDSLETTAGLPKEKIVAAHGNFDTATCLATGQQVPTEEVKDAVFAGDAAVDTLNKKYGGLVKPDIVFFGENLPGRFFRLMSDDFPRCDLLVVMGTSLQVQPFAGLVQEVAPDVPRLLINRERAGEDSDDDALKRFFSMMGSGPSRGFRFDEQNLRDVFFQGDCDDGVWELVRLLGWESEFEGLLRGGVQSRL